MGSEGDPDTFKFEEDLARVPHARGYEQGQLDPGAMRRSSSVIICSPQGAEITVEGRDKPVLNFCANNYLGLSAQAEGHPGGP